LDPPRLVAGQHTIQITAAVLLTSYVPINIPVAEPLIQPVTFRLAWSRLGDTIAAAVAAARSANIAVVFADDNGVANTAIVNWLAPNQDTLIAAVANANPNTVSSAEHRRPGIDAVAEQREAVLEMWYPGQEGGISTARLLLGQANPGGKLPITWPASGDQTPFGGHPGRINGNGTDVPFSEGIYMVIQKVIQKGVASIQKTKEITNLPND
jgi:beta-glucosidase